MRPTRLVTSIVVLVVTLAACQNGTSETSTTLETTTSLSGETETTVKNSRTVETVSCESADADVEIVCQAYDLIKTHYVDEISDEELAEAAAIGLARYAAHDGTDPLLCPLPSSAFDATCENAAEFDGSSSQAAEAMVIGLALNALDANSVYFDEASLALVQEEQGGEIEGIGALVSPEDSTLETGNQQCSLVTETCRIYIISTIEGTPAEKAGLQRDDVVVGVDGKSILGWSVDEVTSQVRGPAGSEVTLTIERGEQVLDVTMTRARVEIPAIESETIGDVGYVRLRLFSQTADEQFEEAVVEQLGAGVEELVIDLRDNPGGLLDTAIAVASVFLPEGNVVVTQSPENSTDYSVSGNSIVPSDIDVTIVVNKGSASASEVVSAVLQEEGLVTVVGENTFGKNTVQQRFPLSNGGALKLTIARWLTPGGLDFGGVGVTPDVDLEVDQPDPESLVAAVQAAT